MYMHHTLGPRGEVPYTLKVSQDFCHCPRSLQDNPALDELMS